MTPKKNNPPPVAAGKRVNAIRNKCTMNIADTSGTGQATGIDIAAPFLIARTFQELQRRRLPLDAASLNRLTFTYDSRPTDAPYAVRAAVSMEARR